MLIPQAPIVVVVQVGTQPKGVLHQVTIRPDKVKGSLIRFGETPGDEYNGWQHLAYVDIVEVLGKAVEEDGTWKCVSDALVSESIPSV